MFSPQRGAPTPAAAAGQALTSQLRVEEARMMKKLNIFLDVKHFLPLQQLLFTHCGWLPEAYLQCKRTFVPYTKRMNTFNCDHLGHRCYVT